MLTAAGILSIILAVFPPPGNSTHSRVRTDGPGPPTCEGYRPVCRAPWQDDAGQWWRYENANEALYRYSMAANALAIETDGDGDLSRIVLASVHEESHLRRDIHEGSTLGDHGESYCLIQRKLGRRSRRGRWLTGVDIDSTRRCLRVAVKAFRRFRRGCHGDPVCMYSAYGGLTTLAGRDHPGIVGRAVLLARLRGVTPQPLAPWVRVALGLDTAPEKTCHLI